MTRCAQTPESAPRYQVASNDLARQFDVAAPHVAWAGAMTY